MINKKIKRKLIDAFLLDIESPLTSAQFVQVRNSLEDLIDAVRDLDELAAKHMFMLPYIMMMREIDNAAAHVLIDSVLDMGWRNPMAHATDDDDA